MPDWANVALHVKGTREDLEKWFVGLPRTPSLTPRTEADYGLGFFQPGQVSTGRVWKTRFLWTGTEAVFSWVEAYEPDTGVLLKCSRQHPTLVFDLRWGGPEIQERGWTTLRGGEVDEQRRETWEGSDNSAFLVWTAESTGMCFGQAGPFFVKTTREAVNAALESHSEDIEALLHVMSHTCDFDLLQAAMQHVEQLVKSLSEVSQHLCEELTGLRDTLATSSFFVFETMAEVMARGGGGSALLPVEQAVVDRWMECSLQPLLDRPGTGNDPALQDYSVEIEFEGSFYRTFRASSGADALEQARNYKPTNEDVGENVRKINIDPWGRVVDWDDRDDINLLKPE